MAKGKTCLQYANLQMSRFPQEPITLPKFSGSLENAFISCFHWMYLWKLLAATGGEKRYIKKNIVETQERDLRDEKIYKFQIGSSCILFHTAMRNVLNI